MSNEHEVTQLRPWQRWRYRAPAAVGLAVVLGSSLLAAQQGGSKHATAGADLPAGPVEASDRSFDSHVSCAILPSTIWMRRSARAARPGSWVRWG